MIRPGNVAEIDYHNTCRRIMCQQGKRSDTFACYLGIWQYRNTEMQNFQQCHETELHVSRVWSTSLKSFNHDLLYVRICPSLEYSGV